MDTIKTIDLFQKPQRNALGQFVNGHQLSVGNEGKSCQFCKNPEEILKKVNLYYAWCKGKVNGRQHMPYLEELCDEEYLDIDDTTLVNWTAKAHDPHLHSKLITAVSRIWMRQKYWLKVKGLAASNSSFYIFLLKANHGMIETERQIQSGDKDNPVQNKLEIEITEAKRHE